MARDIKNVIELADARKLIGATVVRIDAYVEDTMGDPYAVTEVDMDSEGDIRIAGVDRCGWLLTPKSAEHYGGQWIRVLEEPPTPASELDRLRAQRDEIDAKIKAEEAKIARDGLPEGWTWEGKDEIAALLW